MSNLSSNAPNRPNANAGGQTAAKPGFQTDINGMRGLSVLMVVLYHFNLRIFSGGFVGVDIFFVISGYLMTKIVVGGVMAGRFSYVDFVLRRAVRIVPGLFALIAALLALGYFYLPPSDMHSLAEQALQAVYFNSNNYFAAKQGYFTLGADDNWLLHTWSLSVEWQFYMLYPPLVWAFHALARRLSPQRPALVLAALLGATAAASLVYCIVGNSQMMFFSVMARSWQMLAGGLVYMAIVARRRPLRGAALMSYGGCALVIVSLWLVHRYALEALWPSYFAVLPVLAGCLILLAAYEGNLLLNNVVVQRLGSWSYSIYLWHMPLVMAATIAGLFTSAPRMTKIVGVALSLLLGYLSFRFIEPARYLRKGAVRRNYAGLVGAGAVLGAVAFAGVGSAGFLSRVADPAFYQGLTQAVGGTTFDPTCENGASGPDRMCKLNAGAPGGKILVMGDSHAGHLYAWFKRHGKADTTFLVKSGCPMIEGYERVGASMDCAGFTQRAFALAASGQYQTVLISQNWTFFTPRAEGICAWRGGRCVPIKEAADPGAVVASVERSLRQLLDKNIKVAVLDSTPWFTTSAPKKLERDMFWFGQITPRLDSSWFFDENREYDALFDTLGADTRFTRLSLRPLLCEARACLVYDSAAAMPIFKDRDHFNPAWIARHGDIFATLGGAAAAAPAKQAAP